MTRDEMLADLAYARTLAEEGRDAPLIGGSYAAFFGVLLTIAYSAQWALLSGVTPFETNLIGVIWIGFAAIACVGSLFLARRVRDLPGASAMPNRIDRHVWQATVIATMVVVVATISRAVLYDDYTAPNEIVAAAFGFYGIAIYMTATAGGHGWLRSFAVLAWIASGAMWFFLNDPVLYLVAAAASIAVLIVPGVIMMRHEPKSTV